METNSLSTTIPSLDVIVGRIFETRQISRADQERFMRALLSKDALSIEDQRQIDRVFEGLRQGRLRVTN